MKSLFLDANFLFSAAWSPAGSVQAVMQEAIGRGIELCATPHVIEEARRNLVRKRAHALPLFDAVLDDVTRVANPSDAEVARAVAFGIVAKDAGVLAAAVMHRCDGLVTGDLRHFGEWIGQRIEGVLILSPALAYAALVAPPKLPHVPAPPMT